MSLSYKLYIKVGPGSKPSCWSIKISVPSGWRPRVLIFLYSALGLLHRADSYYTICMIVTHFKQYIVYCSFVLSQYTLSTICSECTRPFGLYQASPGTTYQVGQVHSSQPLVLALFERWVVGAEYTGRLLLQHQYRRKVRPKTKKRI